MAPAAKPQLIANSPPRKMTLKTVTRGIVEAPLRICLAGQPGVGKTTWASKAPSPIFLCAEDGTGSIDVARFPLVERWDDALDVIRSLTEEEHDYKSVVIDTLDALEPLVWRAVCERAGKSSIELVGGGYGKGYVAAVDEWRIFLSLLEQLRRKRSMNVIMLAHTVIKTFNPPDADSYDRYELKLNQKASGLLREWCDVVLFACHETFTSSDAKGKTRGVASGARVVHTTYTAAYDAKNRHDLPATLPLDYDDFASAVRAHRPADPDKLRAAIQEKSEQLGDEKAAQWVKEFLASDKGANAAELAKVNDRLTAKLAAKGA